jgi:tellurite methyltransferase
MAMVFMTEIIVGMSDWDKRYKTGEHAGREPDPLITTFAARLKPGTALDLASGAGRHAIWLAERGWQVTAVDYSHSGMQILQERANEKDLRIQAVVADLEKQEFVIGPESYDLIVVCNYLQRDLFPSIRAGTRIGGVVIAVIAIVDNDPEIKPMNPAYLLNPGELRATFDGWQVIHDFEGKPHGNPHRRSIAEIVARRPSLNGCIV